MAIPVLPTKLYAPPLRAQVLRRPALTAKLNNPAHYPLTLIAAPAGFGKTTLVTEWLTHGEQRAAWLALDEDDNEVGRFLTYLIAALRTVAMAKLGEAVLTLLQSPQPPPLRTLLHTLAHEFINALPPCVLVLDDYHVISAQPIHEAVLFLLDHVPTLRWIINTRADPPLALGRLRARQQLLELRAADLRFLPEETDQLLNDVLQLTLSGDAVQELQTKTEGWIAGLQLAALALQSSPERTAFIHAFYGSHRYVADYLVDEVLRHLPDELQDFLLQTAIAERLCAELCEAVRDSQPGNRGQDDTQDASSILEYLERANLFLIPLDNNRQWYRYHHLFADLLRQRLQRRHPTLVPTLHRRAAAWFAQNQQIDDAMRHLFAAKAFEQAADLLEQHQETLWMQGRFVILRQWLSSLPTELITERPQLLLAQVWTHVLTDAAATTIAGLFQQTEAAIVHTAATAGDDQSGLNPLQGSLAAIRAVYCSKQEASADVIANAQQALACLPQASGSWRSIALMALGFAYEMEGAVRAAEQTFTEAIHLCQRDGNHYSAQVSSMRLARTYLVQGQLRRAAATYTTVRAEAAQRNMAQLPNTVHAYINLGRLHYEWNELTAAIDQLQLGLTYLQGQEASWLQFEGMVILARAQQAQGEVAAALALLTQAEGIAQAIPFPWTKGAAASTLVRARLALGHETGADQWLAQAQIQSTAPLNRLREADHFTAARVLLTQGRSAEALPLLTHLIEAAEPAGRLKIVIESCVLAALGQQQQGKSRPAQVILQKALTLAAPEGYIRTFVDEGAPMRWLLATVSTQLRQQPNPEQTHPLARYLDKILNSFPEESAAETAFLRTKQPQSQPLLEPLSARELELLQLMAAGLSNQEIADRLIITLGTVKSHANHIFGKLGVQGRVKAINRARELALL